MATWLSQTETARALAWRPSKYTQWRRVVFARASGKRQTEWGKFGGSGKLLGGKAVQVHRGG